MSAGVHENPSALTRDPQVDVVCWDLRKQKSSFVRPNWPFSPLIEASGYALQLGIRPNQLLESWVELLNVLRQWGHVENHDVKIKRKSRCIALDTMLRRKPQRTLNVFMFPLRDFVATSSDTLAGERHFFSAARKVRSAATAFAACLSVSANLRKADELTNPPAGERRQ